MTISIGDKLPNVTFQKIGETGPEQVTVEEICQGKKVVIIGVPGAFTPTCHQNHLPGFMGQLDVIKQKGVDEVVVVSVNDVHVMGAWDKASEGNQKIQFLADGNAEFAKQTGLDVDLSVAGMGTRSKRFAMITNDGVVEYLAVEDQPGQVTNSSADELINAL